MKLFETFKCSGQILSNSWCQFSNEKSIPLQILYLSSVSWAIISLYFFSPKDIYFAQKEPIKMKISETFKCSGQNSSNSSCQFWNDKSIPFQILHHSSFSWHITSLWILSSYFFYFGLKDPIKIPILRLFENLTYSSCNFPNHKSVFLQILHHPSVSWKINPLYFFRSNIKYFAHFSL